MKGISHGTDLLLGLSLFAALGFAIFCGGTYLYAHGLEIELPSMQLRVKIHWKTPLTIEKYTGPQNVQELMKALDGDYNKGHAKTEVSVSRKGTGIKAESYNSSLTMCEIDARYPRAEWLQLLLDKGLIIENIHGYVSNLSKRHILALLEDNPDLWQSRVLGIPPTDDWETYKTAYINKLINDHIKFRETTERIERSRNKVERAKAQLQHSKAHVERAKAQIEHSKAHVQDAKVQIERSTKEIERVKAQIERSTEQIERAKTLLEHTWQGYETIEYILESPPKPSPPQESN